MGRQEHASFSFENYGLRAQSIMLAVGLATLATLGILLTSTAFASASATDCPNAAIRSSQHTNYLPDCRAVELVNRADKLPQHLYVESFTTPDGNAFGPQGNEVVWSVQAGAPGGASGAYNTFLATRGSDGWGSQTPTPAAPDQVGGGTLKYILVAATGDFSRFIYRTEEPGAAGGSTRATYVRVTRDGKQEVLATFQFNKGSLGPVDVSPDLSHVLHVNGDVEPPQLEDIGDPGAPWVVSVMPDGSTPECGIGESGFVSGFNAPHARSGYHWTSSDGNRVFFQTAAGPGCENHPFGLYLRIRDEEKTLKIADDAIFIRSTPDGRSGFFTSSEALVAGDQNADQDVYRWDEGGDLTCLTCLVSDANLLVDLNNLGAPQVWVSNDFTHVYFESRNQLIPGQGKAGDNNIYALTAGVLHLGADVELPGEEFPLANAKLSADGNDLIFLASGSLTGDVVASQCPENEGSGTRPCEELYRYDDDDGSLTCLSCLHGATTTESVQTPNPQIPRSARFQMSADGKTVLFSTREALLPGDVNGGADIYEWRDGAIGLITDGVTEYPEGLAAPMIVGLDADGSNAFFRVADSGLTGFERDEVDNLYDARIDGGFLVPPPPEHCSEDSCQGPQQPSPLLDQSNSSSFFGPGNIRRQGKPKKPCAHKQRGSKKHCAGKRKHHSQKKKPGATAGGIH